MACWCYCCVRQSLSVSGITQLDSSHRRGHVGLPGHNQNSRAGQETNLSVCWRRLQSSASTMTYLPHKQICFYEGDGSDPPPRSGVTSKRRVFLNAPPHPLIPGADPTFVHIWRCFCLLCGGFFFFFES